MSDMVAEIKGIANARHKNEQKARDDGLRVKKKARMRPRPFCCARPGVNHDGMCACGHNRCPECMILESDAS